MSMRTLPAVFAALLGLTACADDTPRPAAGAQARDITAGRELAEERCGGCHATGEGQADSPHKQAPPFAQVAQRYPAESLGEALAEGIMVGHEDMPEFRFDEREVHDLITYLKSLETP